VIYHPFDEEEMNIEVNAMIEMIHREKPRLILFGASLFLFPHPVKEAVEAAEDVGAKIIYDASHVLGLIAGGLFQDPLREGADVITSSTHKTFPGPQGGIIICKPDIAEEIDAAVFPGTVSNHHLHHLAGLAITLAEMIEFGESYARQIVSNAKVLASELHEGGLNVLCEKKGFTESHQVVLDVSDGSSVAEELERANIITNKMLLPHDSVRRSINPSGLRLGVQELTRIGMKESEMIEIADLIKRVVIDGETEEVKREVTSLKENYQDVHYCFDGRGAYEFPL
jgi:glycine hydroxymethyltransferase